MHIALSSGLEGTHPDPFDRLRGHPSEEGNRPHPSRSWHDSFGQEGEPGDEAELVRQRPT